MNVIKRSALFALMAIIALSSLSIGLVNAASTNVFLNQSVTTNIPARNETLGVANILDGTDNRFAGGANDARELIIDISLDKIYDLNKIVVKTRNGGTDFNKNLTIELGNENNWTTIWKDNVVDNEYLSIQGVTAGDMPEYEFSFDTTSCNVVRVTIKRSDENTTNIQYEIVEISGFGTVSVEQEQEPLANASISTSGATATSNLGEPISSLPLSKLMDGDKSYGSRYVSAVEPNEKLEIVIDLGKSYEIEYIEILERWVNANGSCSDKTQVDIGNTVGDAVLWRRQAEDLELNLGAADNQVVSTPILTEKIVGDKVRFTFDKQNQEYVQYQIVELIVLGRVVEHTELSLGEISLMREGVKIEEISVGEASIEISLPYLLNAESEVGYEAFLVCGVYDKTTNKLVFKKGTKVVLGKSEKTVIPCNITTSWTNCTIKAFLWETLINPAPIAEIVEWR